MISFYENVKFGLKFSQWVSHIHYLDFITILNKNHSKRQFRTRTLIENITRESWKIRGQVVCSTKGLGNIKSRHWDFEISKVCTIWLHRYWDQKI